MTSTNDTTILAMLSRYPDMPAEEADAYISKIQHEENIPICHAVLGRIDKSSLTDDARETYEQFFLWSQQRTRRVREQQWTARRRNQPTSLATRMLELHDKGIVTNEILLLYGISGEMPEQNMYIAMSPEEKESLWRGRLQERFGPDWENLLQSHQIQLPNFRSRTVGPKEAINWKKEGF